MRKPTQLLAVFAAVVFLSIVGLFVFRGRSAAGANASPESSLQQVSVALVEKGAIGNTLTLSGEFHSYQEVDIHAKVAGYIRKIFVDVGDRVKEGQVLAVLEVPELRAQLAGADASILRSQDDIRRAQGDLERSESNHAALHSAYTRLKQASAARPGLIADQELDDSLAKDKESEAQVGMAKAALSSAQQQLLISHASQQQVTAMSDYTRIAAPFSGVITKRYADNGALIQAGTSSSTQAMPVVRLAEISKLRLVLPVPESVAAQIHLKDAVTVRVQALNRDIQGHVARFADSLDRQTRTMQTEIDCENANESLMPGMYAAASIALNQKSDALTIPIQAVDRNAEGATVLVLDRDNVIQEKKIQLGVEGNNRVEVVSGLSENQRVIIGNRSQFHPGDKVQPQIFHDEGKVAGGHS